MTQTIARRMIASAALWLAACMSSLADEFPGKGDKQVWLHACDVCNQGARSVQAGRYADAFKCFEEAIDLYPYDPVFFYDAGVAHQQYAYIGGAKQSEWTQAETYFQKASNLMPGKPDIWLHMANVQNELAKYADSLKSLQTALALPGLTPQDRQQSLNAIEGLKARLGGSVATVASQTALASQSPAPPQNQVAAVPQNQMSGWQSYGSASDPFTMKYPNGWHVATDAKTGRIDVTDEGGAKLSVLPFFSPTPIQSSEVPSFFNGFMRSFSPGESWSKPEVIGSNAVRATSIGARENAVAAMVVTSSAQGTAGKLCIAHLPKGAAAVTSNTFAEMMSSLQFNPQRSAPMAMRNRSAPEGIQQSMVAQQPGQLPPTQFAGYTRFVDPSEHSFTVEVPIGWKVEGGMYRPVSIDARPWVKVASPDNLIEAFIGDSKIPPFSMPTAMGMRLGYRVGSKYGGGEVRPYIPAHKYVELYARSHLQKVVSDLQIVESHEHPDIALAYNGTVGASQSEATSIKLTGMIRGMPVVGYYLAATKATVGYGAGMWWVSLIAGELSPADRAQGGLSVIAHMLQTFQYNSSWKNQSVANAGEVSRQYTIASQAVSKSIVDRYWSQQAANEANHAAYWGRQAVQDHAAENFSDYIRGTETVRDPDTGNKYKVDYGPQYHYINPGGSVVGTNDSAPGPEWRQLMAVP
jgi:hypothetical protein